VLEQSEFVPTRRGVSEAREAQAGHLVFVASQQAVFQCLFHATQRHFPSLQVTLVDRIEVSDPPDRSTKLVLIGQWRKWASPAFVQECRRRFPEAAIGLVVEHGAQDIDPALLQHRLIRGILPMTLPLDVWLAVVTLILAGGEFLQHPAPVTDRNHVVEHADDWPDLAMPPQSDEWSDLPRDVRALSQPRTTAVAADVHERTDPSLDALTARERQVLTLVSEGYQNKLIADRMALSEHTVKAHVHNLIAKLRVTNRTQAAAYLHEHARGMGGGERAQPWSNSVR
jgi:DNA-binding NarL/FixJ family response regulator